LGVTIDKQYTRSLYYIGNDSSLHKVSNINYVWSKMPEQTEKLWPKADEPNAQMAATFHFDTSRAWIYYCSNQSIVQLFSDRDGLWQEAIVLPVVNLTASNEPSQPEATGPGAESNGLSTGAKAGIGVGVAIGVLALISTGALLVYLKRRNGQDRSDSATMINSYENTPSTTIAQPYSDYGNGQWPHEKYQHEAGMNSNKPLELEQPVQVHEMQQQEYPHELMGEGHYREISAIRSER
jgi:hypothetical protein